jgi:hypothetical protein
MPDLTKFPDQEWSSDPRPARWPWVAGAIVLLAGVSLVALGYARIGPLSDLAGPESLDLSQVTRDKGYVAVNGTLHYAVRVQENLRAGAMHFRDEKVVVAPLLPPGDTRSREVHVLVLTPVIPDTIVDFEERTVIGHVLEPNPTLLTNEVLKAWQLIGYTFVPDFVVLKEDMPKGYDQVAAEEAARGAPPPASWPPDQTKTQ